MICTHCFSTNPLCTKCRGSGQLPDPTPQQCGVTKDIRLFGSPQNPLHASALPQLMRCPWSQALIYLFSPEDDSGQAADTGTATHVAVASWHREKEVRKAIQDMKKAHDEGRYQKADLSEAASLFLLYIRDPRNVQAEIARCPDGQLAVERQVKIQLQAAPEDPTQTPIQIIGTLDQVRIVNLRDSVWDLKTSKKPGYDQKHMYLYQQVIYALAASALFGRPVRLGGLITPRHYKGPPEASPHGVFWEYGHRFSDLEHIANGIRHIVAKIRSGDVYITPGDYCRYCPAKGDENCVPMLRNSVDPETKRIKLLCV